LRTVAADGSAIRGLVALGDSITRARGGTPALGIHFQSWAQWLAEALDLPFTNLATDGVLAADVLTEQVPRLRGPYDLGCVYVGVNDARSAAWDAAAFERDTRAIVVALASACARVLVVAPPHDLGRPTAAPKPAQAGAALRTVAAEAGAVLCDLAEFGGRRNVLPDAVHPTSVGEVAIADAAAQALGAPRMPSTLADRPRGGLRFELWWARLWARDVLRRARERRAFAEP
jgi:lysophospholipase L1-like esterase